MLWSGGYLLARALRVRATDRWVAFAVHVALGLCGWPVLFLWTTTAGLRWSSLAMRVVVIGVFLAAAALAWTRRRRMRVSVFTITFIILAVLAAGHRAAHVRDLAFPPWVDGVHHAMTVSLLIDRGAVPASADPFIPGAPFYYHWGFHFPATLVGAALGLTAPPEIPTLLLHYGQLLNALTLVTMYAGGRVLLRSREGGLFTAVLAVFVSYFPAFYVSWGRYTHLAGTLVLPPLLIALWTLARSARPWRDGAAAMVLAAGLVLIHVRVALFALAFAIVLVAAMKRRFVHTLLRWTAAAAFAGLAIAPWLITLAREPHVAGLIEPGRPGAVPMHLLGATHNRELLAIATGGISGMAGWLSMPLAGRVISAAWCLLLIFLSRRAVKSRRIPWPALAILGAWIGLITIVLHWRPFGLDLTGLASLDSAIITLFIPLAAAGGAFLAWALDRLVPHRTTLMACVVAIAIALTGGSATMDVVNPITVFTAPEDLRAMDWIERNAPKGALFAVNARPWMDPAWVGTDGGYWIGVASGRRSILPPLLYGWSLPPAEVAMINHRLANWRVLPEATHLYVGATASRLVRRNVLADPRLRPVYRDGGAIVFEVRR